MLFLERLRIWEGGRFMLIELCGLLINRIRRVFVKYIKVSFSSSKPEFLKIIFFGVGLC